MPALTFRLPPTGHLLAPHRPSAGQVTGQMLELLFSEPLRTIPGNEAHPVPPVVAARLDPGGRFAFVEFRDVAMAEVALHLFNILIVLNPLYLRSLQYGFANLAASASRFTFIKPGGKRRNSSKASIPDIALDVGGMYVRKAA